MIGYAWTQRVTMVSTPAAFPSGVMLTAHVRPFRSAETAITLTTENGGIIRVSDSVVDVTMTAAQTAQCAEGRVILDVVRTDTTPKLHMRFALDVPVVLPVTRLAT